MQLLNLDVYQRESDRLKSERKFGGGFDGRRKIYAIVSPQREVAYVGVSTQPLELRLAYHRQNPTNARMKAWLAENPEAWICLLYKTGEVDWESCERHFIAIGRTKNALLNFHPGGIVRPRPDYAPKPFVRLYKHAGSNYKLTTGLTASNRLMEVSKRQMAARKQQEIEANEAIIRENYRKNPIFPPKQKRAR